VLWIGTAIAALVVAGGLFAWWRSNPERPRVEGVGNANAGWDPAAAGALPEPTGTPVPPPTPIAAFDLGSPTPIPMAPRPTPPMVAEQPPVSQPAQVTDDRLPERPVPPPPPQVEPAPEPTREPERPRAPPQPAADQVVACRELIELDVDPSEAQVWVDGRFRGTADELEEIVFDRPGTYRIRFVMPGYHPQTVEVHVAPDARRKAQEVEVELVEIETEE
jgi:hypothetical protein